MLRKYPSVFLLVPVVAGIIAADQFRLPSWLFLLTCLALLIIGIVAMGRGNNQQALLIFGLCLFCFSGHHFRIKVYEFGPNHISRYVSEKKTFQIYGKVADWPDIKPNRTEIKIALDSLGRNSHSVVRGCILLKISDTTTALQRGDKVEFQGTIYPLKSRNEPGSFDYARYLQLQGIFGIVYLPSLLDVRVDKSRRFGLVGLVDRIRKTLTESLKRNLSPVSAALASGILIGETRDIPNEIYSRFRDSGTLHLLAVSGSNVALMILFVVLVLRPFSIRRKHRAVILIFSVIIFALLSYGEPSVVRASLMAILVLLSKIIERRIDLNQIIATAALIILLIDPAELFNVGFQLSFVTAWGLVFITPRIANLFKPHTNKIWFRWLVLPLLISLVAQICSAPLIAYYFGRVPAISVAANLIIVPLVSVSVVATLLLFVIDIIWPMMGLFFGSLLDLFMNSVFYFLKLFGESKSLVINFANLSEWPIILIYVFLVIATLALFNKFVRRIAAAFVLLTLNLGLAISLAGATSSENRGEYLDIFNIPGGTAILVNQDSHSKPDMIITGIFSRPYPLDERIFETSLRSLEVNRIGRIFVLSAEYGAMDDIIRLSNKFDAKEIYVDKRLERSFIDISSSIVILKEGLIMRTFSVKPSSASKNGIYPSGGNVEIVFGNASVQIINGLDKNSPIKLAKNVPSAVICGSLDNLNFAKAEELRKQGYEMVICSKIDQPINPVTSNALMNEPYEIESLGACRLFMPDDATDSFTLLPIY